MKRLGLLLALSLATGLAAPATQAQTRVALGPRVGFDMANVEELLIGAEARIGHDELAIEVQSAFDYYLPEHGAFSTLSFNVLYLLPLDDEERFTPYAGAGLGFSFYDLGGEDASDTGLNLVGGLRFHTERALTPFVQTQVTLGTVDLIAISGGVLFDL